MCIYTHKKQKLWKKEKISQWGCATPPNVPKLGVSGVMYTAKTNKDLGMSCYIQVEYSVFLRRRPVILGRSVESRTPLEDFFLF